jgi:ribosomal protein S18 acetylase RimI-like enzyme
MIRAVFESELSECLKIIHAAYIPVAERFGLTDDNCPDSGRATLTFESLHQQYENGELMFVYCDDCKIVGYIGMRCSDAALKIDDIVVLPAYQGKGIGSDMLKFAKDYAGDRGCTKLRLGMINNNAELKSWYRKHGFETVALKQYPNAPFVTGYMEAILQIHE